MPTNKGKVWAGIEAMAQSKRERRRKLAALPFERKMEIFRKLQEAAVEIRKATK